MSKAIIVASGGLDSSVVAHVAKTEVDELYFVSFLYGQRHKKELECAEKLAISLCAKEHRFYTLPTPVSALTGFEEIPTRRNLEQMSVEIPSTSVPFRNSIFMMLACQFAEEVGAEYIYLGITAQDFSGYLDCRPEWLEAVQNLINNATEKSITVKAPVLQLYKAEIVRLGQKHNVQFSNTWSCYQGGEVPCMECDSCKLRIKGFIGAGIRDPLIDKKIWHELVNEHCEKNSCAA